MQGEMKTERITTMMTPSEVKALDDWAFANRIRSRGEAIRRLIEAGLKARDKVPIEPRSGPEGGKGGDEPDEAAPSRGNEAPAPKAAPLSIEDIGAAAWVWESLRAKV